MIFTIFYFFLIVVFALSKESKKRRVNWILILSTLYWGLRYQYQSDYEAYEYGFGLVGKMATYDQDFFHAEYGWWLLCKIFQPVGFYVFVFLCSVLLCYALKDWFVKHVNKDYLWLVALGLFSAPYFTVLSSAQRQWLVSALFLLSFNSFLIGKINSWKDLFKINVLYYILIILFCSYFHKSSVFLLIIPLLYLFPRNSWSSILSLLAVFLIEMLYGASFVPEIAEYIISSSGEFLYLSDMLGEGAMEKMSAINWVMNVFQFITISYVYAKGNLSRDESVFLILTLLAIITNSTAFFVPELHRLSMYFVFFQYITIGIVLSKLNSLSQFYYTISYVVYTIWIAWSAYKVLTPAPTAFSDYKCVLMLLFS